MLGSVALLKPEDADDAAVGADLIDAFLDGAHLALFQIGDEDGDFGVESLADLCSHEDEVLWIGRLDHFALVVELEEYFFSH